MPAGAARPRKRWHASCAHARLGGWEASSPVLVFVTVRMAWAMVDEDLREAGSDGVDAVFFHCDGEAILSHGYESIARRTRAGSMCIVVNDLERATTPLAVCMARVLFFLVYAEGTSCGP